MSLKSAADLPIRREVITVFRSLPGTFGKMVSDFAKPPGKAVQKRKVALLCCAIPAAVAFFPVTLGFTVAKAIQDISFFPRQNRFREVFDLADDDESRQLNNQLSISTLRLTYESIEIQNDFQHLQGWLFRTDQSKARGVILFFHSNNMSAIGAANLFAKEYTEYNFHCVFTEYPGYGQSEGSIYSDHDIKLAANAFYEQALVRFEGTGLPFFVYGSSIGTAPAMYLAANKDTIKKAVLDAPFRNYKYLAKTLEKSVPGCLIQYHMSTEENLRQFMERRDTRTLVLHATGDKMIPYKESMKMITPYKGTLEHCHRAILHTAGGNFSFYTEHNELNDEDTQAIKDFLSSGAR